MTRQTGEQTAPTQVGVPPRRGLWFAILSAPLLLGLFVPVLPVLALLTVPLAQPLGQRVWPGIGRGPRLVYSLAAVVVVWVIPTYLVLGAGLGEAVPSFGPLVGIALLVIPVCSIDTLGLLLPAAVATAAYSLVGAASVRFRRPGLWLMASALVAPVHALTLLLVSELGVGGELLCI